MLIEIIVLIIIFTIMILYLANRYFKLLLTPLDNYTQNYNNLDKISNDEKVIISFPLNKHKSSVNHMLKSVMDQTHKVDKIIAVSYPKVRPKKSIYKTIKVIPSGKEYGNITDIITPLIVEKDCETVIILLNNDTIYDKNFINLLYNEHLKDTDKMLYNSDFILVKPSMFGCLITSDNNYNFEWLLNNVKKSEKININVKNYKTIF